MNDLVKEGRYIIISSELPEVINMSDRVVVMSNGDYRLSAPRNLTQEKIMHHATQFVFT